MKIRILTGIIVIAIIGCGVFGVSKRRTYTDITSEPDYLKQVLVAELLTQMAVSNCEQMIEILPNAPIILRVSFTDDVEHLFGVSRQKAVVEEAYAGDTVKAGDEIYITARHWSMIVEQGVSYIERGFVNIPRQERQYLVFIDGEIETLDDSLPVYQLYDESLIAPVFCYEDISNEVVPLAPGPTYVPYSRVQDNEFFVDSEEGLDAWYQLKKELLAAYPMN